MDIFKSYFISSKFFILIFINNGSRIFNKGFIILSYRKENAYILVNKSIKLLIISGFFIFATTKINSIIEDV